MTVPADLDRIERALKVAKRMAANQRYGGLRELWYDLGFALDAVERVRVAWAERPVQVGMFGVEDG